MAQPEDTTAILQQAADSGVPVLIPGALEMRVGRPAPPPTTANDQSITPHVRPSAVCDRERLEHEREGGGALRQRTGDQHHTILAKLWHAVFHPTDLLAIWRPPLPQQR